MGLYFFMVRFSILPLLPFLPMLMLMLMFLSE
jgi:hypothetical protein